MKYVLYRIETYGMKNIKNKITLDFCPLTIDNKSNKKVSKVKAIYGANGSGKSAILNSIRLFKMLVINENLLKQTSEIKKLNKIINKQINEFYISVVYSVKYDMIYNDEIYKNEFIVKLDNGIPYIESEKFYTLKGKSINGEYSLIYEANNGTLKITNKESKMDEYFVNRTLNILKYSSCSSITSENDVIKEINKYLIENDNYSSKQMVLDSLGVLKYLIINRDFANNISIYLEEQDMHKEFDDDMFEKYLEKINNKDNESMIRNTIGSNIDIIRKSGRDFNGLVITNLDLYKNNIKRLTTFLQLFKPTLKEIKLEIKEDEQFYYCNKKMVYDGYTIDSDYESTGIQKLMNIYNSIEDVTKGKMVFIDELDANISGIYLEKLIEYLNDLNKGQLCFTTHDYYLMKTLSDYTNALDFLGEKGKLVSWTKNGNYKPYNQYPEGMIMDSPYNIEALDFARLFNK